MRIDERCAGIARLAGMLLVSAAGLAAGSAFNGRWDIRVTGDTSRAWWMELQDVGTPAARGSFVSDFWGDLNRIDEMLVGDGELKFGFHHQENGQEIHDIYSARLEGGKLIGTARTEGSPKPPVNWVGVRAPAIGEKDDGSWRAGQPVVLFNHKDMAGWRSLTPDKPFGWSVEDSLLKATGRASNLVSEQKFWNFELHVEFRLPERSNSGIGLRSRYEVQILEDYGRLPNSHGNGAVYSRILPSENASKPAGEWQTYDIRLVGRHVTVVLNGKKVIDNGLIEGLTSIANDPDEGLPGALTLQGDHGPVDFREVVLTPLLNK